MYDVPGIGFVMKRIEETSSYVTFCKTEDNSKWKPDNWILYIVGTSSSVIDNFNAKNRFIIKIR